jgi:hypothetical protein
MGYSAAVLFRFFASSHNWVVRIKEDNDLSQISSLMNDQCACDELVMHARSNSFLSVYSHFSSPPFIKRSTERFTLVTRAKASFYMFILTLGRKM